ncbi:hypothetical protein B0T11DRAFT_326883 [Plectosphaerella cucumerina]|uniref:CipC-like antibiotic response protein n=1 Tax=Plectosphaerella cucumerina TaxID=40658 RepID=A0A8K0TQ73_9PEZI|nr:hypothetical protein B0T11DRAFT_326883 [Plectosphaerella cucumerina]
MFGFDEARDNREDAYGEHRAKLSHEVVAGGAAFEAMKLFEDRQRRSGEPVKHQFAKELLMGFAGAEVDRLVETKGMDYLDQRRARDQAQERAAELYDRQYGDMEQYDPNQRDPHPHFRNY